LWLPKSLKKSKKEMPHSRTLKLKYFANYLPLTKNNFPKKPQITSTPLFWSNLVHQNQFVAVLHSPAEFSQCKSQRTEPQKNP